MPLALHYCYGGRAVGVQLTSPPLPPQERKSVAATGLTLQRLSGDAITPGTWDAFYRFYRNTTGAVLCGAHCFRLRVALRSYNLLLRRRQVGTGIPDARVLPPTRRCHGAPGAFGRSACVYADGWRALSPACSSTPLVFAWFITLEVKWGAHAWQGDRVVLATAVEAGGTPVAGALNLRGSHALFGRNWGCARDVKHLHFELCYYQALEAAIELRLPRVEAGAQVAPGARACPPALHACMRVLGALTALAGRPRRASTRSSAGDAFGPPPVQLLTCMLRSHHAPLMAARTCRYLPSLTYSSHYIRDLMLRGAVANFLRREKAQVEYNMEALTACVSPYKDVQS